MKKKLGISFTSLIALLFCFLAITLATENAVQTPDAPYLDVRAYGAKGDGKTDDTAAINAALADAFSGRRSRKILFPNGTYITNGITTNLQNVWSITIEGQSVTGSQIKLKNNSNKDVIAVNKGQRDPLQWPAYWVFRNILIDGNSENNTAGDCVYLYHANEFKFDNVVVQNCAGYNYNIQNSLGIEIDGFTILGNTVNSAKGQGGINIYDSGEIIINGAAVQSFSQPVWPLTITKTASYTDPVNITLNSFYLEDNYNGIKLNLDGSGAGANIVFNQPRLIGLSNRKGGTLFDITGDSRTIVRVEGGSVYGSWDAGFIKTSSNASMVEFNNVFGIYTQGNYQEDKGGYKSTNPVANESNIMPNGNMLVWGQYYGLTFYDIPRGFSSDLAGGATYQKDTVNYRSAGQAWKLTASAAQSNYLEYKLTDAERAWVEGKYLNLTTWVKGATADAAHAIIVYVKDGRDTWAGSVPNVGTDWERLRAAQFIPKGTSAVYLRIYVKQSKTATIDEVVASINSAVDYRPKFLADNKAKMIGTFTDSLTEATIFEDFKFGPNDGNVYILTASRPGLKMIPIEKPQLQFEPGTSIHLFPISNAMVFDPSGINVTVAAGKHGIFYKKSVGWIGSQVD